MISSNFGKKALLVFVLFTLTSGGSLFAQSATDPLSDTPALVSPVAPLAPAEDAPATAPAVDPCTPLIAPTPAPEWFTGFLGMVSAIPAIGGALAVVVNWMAALAALLTALSSVLLAIKKVLENMGTRVPYADIMLAWVAKVYPYVAWLSMYNVQKKPAQ